MSIVDTPSSPTPSASRVVALVDQAATLLNELGDIDPAELDAAGVAMWATGVERLRRQVEAASTAVAAHIDHSSPFVADGWFTAKRWLKHNLQLSGPEAHRRVQAARFAGQVPEWAAAQAAGEVGVAQHMVMASVAANPRIEHDTLVSGALALLDDAITLPFDDFERLARTWEMLADPQGSLEVCERNRQRRDASIRPRPDGGWDVHALLDDVAGAEMLDIFAWYIDAEFRSDWTEAVDRLGDGNVSMGDLRRTEPQRRADALVAMARAAAAAPPDATRPVPTVDIVVDATTYDAWLAEAFIDPDDYRNVTCRTARGHRLHPHDVVNASLWAMVRRVVVDSRSVVTDLGRRSRLFTGPARESVMLLEDTCVWTGCDQPTRWCHADHLDSWTRARGPTRPDNGAPLCPRHNYLKEQGFTVNRDDRGGWHVHAPDGHEV